MGFFSNRRNRIIEEEITNALLYSEGFHDTSIFWEAFEKFAKENGAKINHNLDGGHDTKFEMVTNDIEVKVIAFRYPFDGSTSLKVQTLTYLEEEADKFATDFKIKARGGIPKNEELEDEDELENLKDGERIKYYDDGQIESKSNYKNGKLHGQYTVWDEDGELFNEDNYIDGERHGKQTSYLDGEVTQVDNYKDGERHGKQTSYLDGEIFSEENYKDGERHGKQTSYLDGEIFSEENYIDGKFIEEIKKL